MISRSEHYRYLTAPEIATIRSMYEGGGKIVDIARAVGRNVGTVSTTVFRWRRAGLIVGRLDQSSV